MKTVSKKNKPAGVYSTTSSTSLPLNISWPSTINYSVKNMSLGVDHSSGLDSKYSTWTWAFPGNHDRKIIKKKQRRDIDNFLKRFEEKKIGWYDIDTIPWLDNDGFSFKSSSGPLSPPTGMITYMDFLNTYNGGNNNNNP